MADPQPTSGQKDSENNAGDVEPCGDQNEVNMEDEDTRPLGHNDREEHQRLLGLMLEPWRHEYKRIKRKKPRKPEEFLQLTQGEGRKFDKEEIEYLKGKPLSTIHACTANNKSQRRREPPCT